MKKTVLYMDKVESPLGTILLSSHGEKLNGLWFQGEKYEEIRMKTKTVWKNGRISLYSRKPGVGWTCISRGKIQLTPPLQLSGSDFRQQVGRIMLTILTERP